MARSTASSQAALPLLLTSLWLVMVPSGATRTSTSARGLPGADSVNTTLGLMRAATLPA